MVKARMFLAMLFVAGAAVGVETWTDPRGIQWAFEYNSSSYTATIGNGLTHAITFATEGKVFIPDEVFYNGDAYKVTAIADKAFQTCSKIEFVSIPEAVTFIGDKAFDGCSALEDVMFHGDVGGITVDFAAAFGGTPYADSINANDNFADAEDLGSDKEGAIYDMNILSTEEAGEPLPVEKHYYKYTKWYRWTAPEGVTSAIFHTYGSGFDTVLGVYTGTAVDALTKVAANDDGCDDSTSKVGFPVTPGETYHICVAGYGETGAISLSWCASSEFALVVAADGTLCGFVGDCPEEVVIQDHVERIGDMAFSREIFGMAVDGLKRVVIPAGIESIGEGAFKDCLNLAEVEFEGGVIDVDIETDVFKGTAFLNGGAFNANEKFANAKDLGAGVSGTVMDLNGSATWETGEPLYSNYSSERTKWYKWKAPEGVSSALFSTYGSDFDTVIGVYTGTSVDALTEVAANDDSYDGRQSRVKFDVMSGTTYYICVGGYQDGCGLISLNWHAADGFALAVSDGGTLYGITGTCPENLELTDDVRRIVNCAFYKNSDYEPTAGNIKSIEISGSVERIGRGAFSDCDNLADVAFAGLMQDVEIGDDAFDGTKYMVNITANDNFSDAAALPPDASGTLYDCNYEAQEELGEPMTRKSIYYRRSKWYKWTTTADTYVWLDTFGSDFDTMLGVYTGSDFSSLSEVCFNDDRFDDFLSGASFLAEAGKTYYICVAGYDGEYGQIVLNWKTANDFELIIDESGTLRGFVGECPSELELPGTVQQIGPYAFSSQASPSSKNLSRITIPGSVKKIESYAFDGCEYLITVTLSEGLEALYAFSIFKGCSSLHYIEVPISVQNLTADAFYDMDSSVEICLPNRFRTELTTGSYGTTDLWATYYVNLTFDVNGGTDDLSSYCGYFNCGDPLYVPEPNREGYTFNGWDPEFSGIVPDEDTTYKAKWTVHENYVSFYAEMGEFYENGGVDYLDTTVAYGSPIVVPKVRREGYTFDGWDPELPATMPDENISFTAQWTPNKYKVVFDANGGTGGTELTMEYDSALWEYVPETTREGYTFLGWEPELDDFCPDHDVTYKAKWELNECWVSFYANGGEFVESGDSDWQKWMSYGETLTAPAVKWDGHIFKGWSPKVPSTVPDEEYLSFEAQWTPNKHKVTFDTNGGTGGTELTMEYDSALWEYVPETTREGYTFLGWEPELDDFCPDHDVTYKAKWELNEYRVSFYANGGEFVENGGSYWQKWMNYGETLTAPEVKWEGHIFRGWSPKVPSTVPDEGNLTFEAQWELARCSVTVDLGGGTGTGGETKVDQGTLLNELPCPEKEGYSFDGWYTAPKGGVKLDEGAALEDGMTIYAQWTWSGYKVTFHANNGTADYESVGPFNAGDLLGEDLNRFQFDNPRHVLEGWYTADGVRAMESLRIDGDVDLYAHWKECILYRDVTGQVPATASVYDGYLRDVGGKIRGTLQAKVGKTGGGKAKVKLSVQMVGGKKQSGKGTLDVSSGELKIPGITLKFGSDGLEGDFGEYTVDGARNIFASKTDGAAASAVLNKWLGPVNVKWNGGQLSVVIGKKGKVKISGMVGGTKVSATSQLLVGEDMLCIPVVVTKKANVLLELWLSKEGGSVSVIGIDNAVVGKARTLGGGALAEFSFNSDRLCELIGDRTYLNYLPNGVPVKQVGTIWVVANGAKAGRLQLRRGATALDQIDLVKAGGNPSALKLSYKAKDGSFKGSFKAYVVDTGRPKAVTVKVTGLLIGGIGYGEATIKKSGSVPVTIR